MAEQVIIPTRGGSPRAAMGQFFQRVRAITGARRIWQLANAVIESICVLHGNIEPWLWWVCARTAQVQTAADNMLSSCCNPSFANSLNPPYAAESRCFGLHLHAPIFLPHLLATTQLRIAPKLAMPHTRAICKTIA